MAECPKGVTARTCAGQVEVSEASVSMLPPKTRPKGRLRTGEPPGKNRQRSVVGFRAPQRPTPSGGEARSASAQGARPPLCRPRLSGVAEGPKRSDSCVEGS